MIHGAVAVVATIFDGLGRHEPGHHRRFRVQSPLRTRDPELNTAIAHLREVLGDQNYESLARKGELMTTAAMATYAYDQIDQARAELKTVSKEHICDTHRTPCRARDSARRDVSEVRLTTRCLIFRP